MTPLQWQEILKVIQHVSAGFSMIINTVLIYIILTKSPKQLGAYKYLMIFISVFEIAYSILDILLMPQTYSHGVTFLVLVGLRDKFFGPFGMTILNSFYWAFFGASMTVFAVHFVYRWLVVSENSLLASFNDWRFFLWLGVPFGYGLTWALTGIFLCGPSEATNNFVRENVKENFGWDLEDFIYLGPLLFEKLKDGGYKFQPAPFLGLAFMLATIITSVIVVLVFGALCYLRIDKLVQTSSSSVKFQKLQKQLFYALVIQTVIPFVLMHIPVGIMFTFVFLDIDWGVYTALITMTVAIYPAADPIPTIVIIESYRKAVLQWICPSKPILGTMISVTGRWNSSNL